MTMARFIGTADNVKELSVLLSKLPVEASVSVDSTDISSNVEVWFTETTNTVWLV